MRALSLLQPWASLLAMGAKKWETRSWKPSPTMLYVIREQGILIHASVRFDVQNRNLATLPPFCGYLTRATELPTGAIIGYIRVGKIIPTDTWMTEFNPDLNEDARTEQAFGNYNRGRWAWEMLESVAFDAPIPCKGALSLWNYKGEIPRIEKPENFL